MHQHRLTPSSKQFTHVRFHSTDQNAYRVYLIWKKRKKKKKKKRKIYFPWIWTFSRSKWYFCNYSRRRDLSFRCQSYFNRIEKKERLDQGRGKRVIRTITSGSADRMRNGGEEKRNLWKGGVGARGFHKALIASHTWCYFLRRRCVCRLRSYCTNTRSKWSKWSKWSSSAE